MKETLEDFIEAEKLGVTAKSVTRYLEVVILASFILEAIIQGITEDWRLSVPCTISGLYWFVTHHHKYKLAISCVVYAVFAAILMHYFDRGPIEFIEGQCSGADNYFDCLKNSKPTFQVVIGIQTLLGFLGVFVVYMSNKSRDWKNVSSIYYED